MARRREVALASERDELLDQRVTTGQQLSTVGQLVGDLGSITGDLVEPLEVLGEARKQMLEFETDATSELTEQRRRAGCRVLWWLARHRRGRGF